MNQYSFIQQLIIMVAIILIPIGFIAFCYMIVRSRRRPDGTYSPACDCDCHDRHHHELDPIDGAGPTGGDPNFSY